VQCALKAAPDWYGWAELVSQHPGYNSLAPLSGRVLNNN